MLYKNLKKFYLLVSTGLTTFFEALINLIDKSQIRQILNPIAVLVAICISILGIYLLKCFSINKIIKNNQEEIAELMIIQVHVPEKDIDKISAQIHRCRVDNLKLKKDKSKIDLF